jgi:hypothetical protein
MWTRDKEGHWKGGTGLATPGFGAALRLGQLSAA